jgi:hypothetical protein
MPRCRRLLHHHEPRALKLLHKVRFRRPSHHLARHPELLPGIELRGVRQGLLQLRGPGRAEVGGCASSWGGR